MYIKAEESMRKYRRKIRYNATTTTKLFSSSSSSIPSSLDYHKLKEDVDNCYNVAYDLFFDDPEYVRDELSCFRGLILDISYRPINVVCRKQALCLEFMVRTEEGQASRVGQGVTGAKGAEEGPASRSRLGSGNAGQGYAFEEVKVLFLILMDLCRRTSGLAHQLPVSQVGSNNIQVRLHYTVLPEVVEASLGPHMQDLAVVVLLILIPLISPNSSKGGVGFQAIAEAVGLASLKAVIAISAIIAGGRLLLRPIYKQIAENQNAEIFSANTLLYKEETTDAAMAAKDAAEKSLRLADLRSSRLTYSMVVELGFRSWFM
ncbi:hypothetical protein POM88_009193 [Heracleum sosnowskyi]|uniref:Uncharacterized protein n=1 Tax=Heracleum sosnowskyi TaxID=360622 RepID=A0AAD8N2G9_9APIA|nr:hypothetical protein POM88_009193 [Heracleum sosnowskyi]